jgi:hypothetical protein
VYVWKVHSGKLNDFLANVPDAIKIHNALGASAGYNIEDTGGYVYYELTFDSWASWAKFDAALSKSTEWDAFMTKLTVAPTADLVRVVRLQDYTAP